MERHKDWLIFLMLEPWVLKGIGSVLMTLSSFALLLGLRYIKFEHRIDRLFSRLHALSDGQTTLPTPPGLFNQWPIIQAMVPETVFGFVTWSSLLVAGWMLVRFGKKIARLY